VKQLPLEEASITDFKDSATTRSGRLHLINIFNSLILLKTGMSTPLRSNYFSLPRNLVCRAESPVTVPNIFREILHLFIVSRPCGKYFTLIANSFFPGLITVLR